MVSSQIPLLRCHQIEVDVPCSSRQVDGRNSTRVATRHPDIPELLCASVDLPKSDFDFPTFTGEANTVILFWVRTFGWVYKPVRWSLVVTQAIQVTTLHIIAVISSGVRVGCKSFVIDRGPSSKAADETHNGA